MTPARRKAVLNHRQRLEERGLVRLEVQAPKSDRELIRKVVGLLRGDLERADEVRRHLQRLVGGARGSGLKELLASAPLEGIDLTRDRGPGREVEL